MLATRVDVVRASFRGQILSLPSTLCFAMERLEQRRVLSAALDAGFGVGGILDLGTTAEAGSDRVAFLPDGRFLTLVTEIMNNQSAAVITRYRADGSIDSTFGTAGTVRALADKRGNGYLTTGIDVDDGGNIILVGGSITDAVPTQWTARLTPDGALDQTFGNGGIENYQDGDYHLPDGSVLRELARNVGEPLRFLRFRADGSIDTRFGIDGVLSLPDYTPRDTSIPGGFFGQDRNYAAHYSAVTVDPQGRIYFVGQAYDNQVDVYGGYSALVRVTADGELDQSFGESGSLWVSEYVARGLFAGEWMFDSQGRMVIAVKERIGGFVGPDTDTTSKVRVIRLLDNGSFDPSFGEGGSVLFDGDGSHDAELFQLRLQRDDKVLFIGSLTGTSRDQYNPAPGLDVIRLNVDGSRDAGFAPDGRFTLPTLYENGTYGVGDISLTDEALTIGLNERTAGVPGQQGAIVRIDLDGVIEPVVKPNPIDPATPVVPDDVDEAEAPTDGVDAQGGFAPLPAFATIDRAGKAIVLGSLGEDVLDTRRDRAIDLV